MSQANVAVAKQVTDVVNWRELDSFVDLVTGDFEWFRRWGLSRARSSGDARASSRTPDSLHLNFA
jgi:hypothetical protein